MDLEGLVRQVLDDTLSLNGRAQQFTHETPLLGAVPELDSMAVAQLIVSLESKLGVAIDDDEIDGTIFESFGALVQFAFRMQASTKESCHPRPSREI